jgi:hypothetical protein
MATAEPPPCGLTVEGATGWRTRGIDATRKGTT